LKCRTIFAQNSLKPEEVALEWEATQTALGGYDDTERFVFQAMKRLGQPLEPLKSGAYKVALHLVPDHIKERFVSESLIEDADIKPLKVGFSARPPSGTISVHRAHALPSVLASTPWECHSSHHFVRLHHQLQFGLSHLLGEDRQRLQLPQNQGEQSGGIAYVYLSF
jgi:hypothetical protein